MNVFRGFPTRMVYLYYIMLEIHHSGREPSNYVVVNATIVQERQFVVALQNVGLTFHSFELRHTEGLLISLFRDNLLQSPHCAAKCLQNVRSSGPGAIVCKGNTSSAYRVQRVVLRATWYERAAHLLILTDFKSHLFLIYFIG